MSWPEEVAAALASRPGQTPTQVRDLLRASGRVSVTTGDVATVLRTYPGRFRPDQAEPQRWWPADGLGPTAKAPVGPGATLPQLYAWQAEALEAWRGQGHRGVVEAVTGTGKTMVGIAAAVGELARRGQVCVLVPTAELLGQWHRQLARLLPASVSIGLLGAGHHDDLGHHDVLVAVVNSARTADLRPRRPGGLLVADECHRYGTEGNRVALEDRFGRRLGLSATYARADDGHVAWLDPYFGRTCFRMGYGRAIADGVAAHVDVALVGVAFDRHERATYDELCLEMSRARAVLVARHGVPIEPVGLFFQVVGMLARGDGPAASAARQYLWAMQERRRLLADTPAKAAGLDRLAPAVQAADRTIVFTQTIAAAEAAAARLRSHGLRAGAIHSGLDAAGRRTTLEGFRDGFLQAVAAPQVLDEGVDVPAADLGVILASSHSRRQMVQRMGRVLRRKPDGRRARFVIVFVEATVEDPASGAHEGFLGEVTLVADEVRRFPAKVSAEDVCGFLRRPGP